MISKTEIEQIIASQKEKNDARDTGLRRDILPSLPDLKTHALVISGVRRCGKSTLLLQLARERDPGGLFLNFDDPRLTVFDARDFQLLDLIIASTGARSLFLDEPQVIEGWELYVRQKLDEGFRVVVTGSNASLLSRELGTKLTGRHVTKELFPFSLNEFLSFKNLAPGPDTLAQYLAGGGLPEFLKTGNTDILAALFHDILNRDIVVRHNIRDARSLKRLAVYLLTNAGNAVTAGKLRQIIGVKAVTTLLEYFSFLEDAYLAAFLPRFSWSPKVQSVSPRKVYAIDPALTRAVSAVSAGGRGRALENMVYWELRRTGAQMGAQLYYFNEAGAECDFVVMRDGQPAQLVQVCHELTHENREREQRGLRAAMDFLKTDNALILTAAQKDAYIENNRLVNIIPAWEFFT